MPQYRDRLRDDYAEEELRASGLFNERGLIFYRHPIVFPFYHQGKACFLQGRRVDGREPKYLSVRRPICCLYNHDILATLSPGDAVVLSEGVIDTLTWLEYGVPAVGILGVGCFKSEWIPKFRDRRVLICLDNDEPGQRAARDLRQRFIAAGQQAFLVTLPRVKDINELFLKYRAWMESPSSIGAGSWSPEVRTPRPVALSQAGDGIPKPRGRVGRAAQVGNGEGTPPSLPSGWR